MELVPVIGLEVHVQLATASKMFCRCPNDFGGEPNSRVCPVCLGYPGALPVLNGEAVELAARLALALGCSVSSRSIFARKNYFYPDLPKGYQISQYEQPLAERGSLPIDDGDWIAIGRLHLEEDAGKLLHETPGGGALPGESLIDFNRCGVPLVEIVTEPELTSPQQAQSFLKTLHQVLRYTDTSDANMEEGSLRCDANVSLRRQDSDRLGTKVEVKNLNSFRHVARALEHEIERQGILLESHRSVAQETRSFDAGSGKTRSLRGKEEAHDYRYFPEPDLRPLDLSAERRASFSDGLPELPWKRRQRLVADYGLAEIDAEQLVATKALADYYESAVTASRATPKALANWVMVDLQHQLRLTDRPLDQAVAAPRLGRLAELVEEGSVSHTAAREVLTALFEQDEDPEILVDRLGLRQVRDDGSLSAWVGEVIAEHPDPAEQFRAGERKVIGFLVGQVMQKSAGRADPKQVRELIDEALSSAES